MASNAGKGAYYKGRSKRWLEANGFTVFDMEIQRVVFTPIGALPTKRDQLASDLGYLATDVVVFVQVKHVTKDATTTVAKKAARAFAEYNFPIHSRREIHVWRRGARAPEVVACQ